MKTIGEFSDLLQYVYDNNDQIKLTNSKKTSSIKPNILTYFSYVLKQGEGYIDYEITKKSGGKRKISKPKESLKIIQKCLLEILSILYKPHHSAHGFIKEKNVVTNSAVHVGKKYIFNIDIKDFFPSTSFHKIKFLLSLKPFFLNGEREEIGSLIANLCCKEGFLPQGAPTSPIITNIVCRRIDSMFWELARVHKAKYTRYADDITFSSNKNIFDECFFNKIKKILSVDKYEINPQKTRLSLWYQRQEVTGVVVNQKQNLAREYIKDIRYWLFSWEKFKAINTQSDFEKRYPEKKGFHRYNKTIGFKNYLFGKIQYLKMVRGFDDRISNDFLTKYYLLEKSMENKVQIPTTITVVQDNQSLDNSRIYNQITKIREILEVRGDTSIDYEFIEVVEWRNKLLSDNLKMENCAIRFLGDDGRSNNNYDAFIDYCTYAFFQIEFLLNIYFKKKYIYWEDLISTIEELKTSNKLYQKFELFKNDNEDTDKIPTGGKLSIYNAIFDSDGLDLQSIENLKEIRNTIYVHRPAAIDKLRIKPQDHYLLKDPNIEKIRSVLINFVKHIQSKLSEIKVL